MVKTLNPLPLTNSRSLHDLLAWRAQTYLQTVEQNRWIPRRQPGQPKAHPRQRLFLLLADVSEVLFGGAAGGGKSDALLMAAAQYVDVPGYSAVLFRKTFADLNEPDALIPRSKEWWLGKAKWDDKQHRWTFPSGATITFRYLANDNDVENYQGAAYHFVAFDELTQHTEYRYRYMFSRMRKRQAGSLRHVPLRMRGGTNPGREGHTWVKNRFINTKTKEASAVFIPSKLDDNPSLNRDDYVTKLMHLDPVTREQLLAGNWDALTEGRFKKEWLRYYTRVGDGYRLGELVFTKQEIRQIFLTVDPAATVKQTAKHDPDWTVISAWGMTPSGLLLWLGCERARIEVPDIPGRIQQQYVRHGATRCYIEGGGTQKAVAQIARRHKPPMNIIEVPPEQKDKLVKATPFLNMAEAGRVWLPAPGAQDIFPLDDVESELLRFTGDQKQSGHDDIVDTAGMACTLIQNNVIQGIGGSPRVLSA